MLNTRLEFVNMSPRPRKVSDDEIFLAAQRVMSRRGPKELTLADIAAEAGVTAGRLVQRFGGKRELLLALSSRSSPGSAARTRRRWPPCAPMRRGWRTSPPRRTRSRAISPTCRSI
jgi:hypothetical protein